MIHRPSASENDGMPASGVTLRRRRAGGGLTADPLFFHGLLDHHGIVALAILGGI